MHKDLVFYDLLSQNLVKFLHLAHFWRHFQFWAIFSDILLKFWYFKFQICLWRHCYVKRWFLLLVWMEIHIFVMVLIRRIWKVSVFKFTCCFKVINTPLGNRVSEKGFVGRGLRVRTFFSSDFSGLPCFYTRLHLSDGRKYCNSERWKCFDYYFASNNCFSDKKYLPKWRRRFVKCRWRLLDPKLNISSCLDYLIMSHFASLCCGKNTY